jgi:hypothetical protein
MPAAGEIRAARGRMVSTENRKRCWMTLPAKAARQSSMSGMPSVESTAIARCLASAAVPGPSAGNCQEWAMRPRNVAARLAAIGGASTISTKVPPASMNQVLTSALLTTSPRLIASSSRFGVGSSVRSLSSRSSAIAAAQPCGASAPKTPPA